MTTDTKSQSKQLGKRKVGIASEEVTEKTSVEENHSAGLTWKEHFFNAICLIASKILWVFEYLFLFL